MESLRDPNMAAAAGAVVGLVVALGVIYGMKPKCCMAADSTESMPKFDNQKVAGYSILGLILGAGVGYGAAAWQQGGSAGYSPVPPGVPMGFRFAFEEGRNTCGFGGCGY